jgi:hypothetical protein
MRLAPFYLPRLVNLHIIGKCGYMPEIAAAVRIRFPHKLIPELPPVLLLGEERMPTCPRLPSGAAGRRRSGQRLEVPQNLNPDLGAPCESPEARTEGRVVLG